MRSLRLLLSERALKLLSPEIAAVLGDRPYQLATYEQLTADGSAPAPFDVSLAFISRDVTGASTKFHVSGLCRDCYTLLEQSLNLDWVHVHSAGADRPIFDLLKARGVTVTTSNGANAQVVAHTAVGGVLALARRFPQFMRAQGERRWAPLQGQPLPRDLDGQTAVVIGWGPIGQKIARYLEVMGLRIIVVRDSDRPAEGASHTVPYERVQDVLPLADWVILACPLTMKTLSLIDAAKLAALPRGASLVNVARGEVVVQEDLVAAVQGGQVGGAFLDVFATEPLDTASPLWGMPNVMVTPHAAGHSDGNYRRVADIFLTKLSNWLEADGRSAT